MTVQFICGRFYCMFSNLRDQPNGYKSNHRPAIMQLARMTNCNHLIILTFNLNYHQMLSKLNQSLHPTRRGVLVFRIVDRGRCEDTYVLHAGIHDHWIPEILILNNFGSVC